jgi:hypothetical protein
LYVPTVKSDKTAEEEEPAIAPGLMIQFPAGKPFSTTLPVADEQVGCVIAPTIGAAGEAGGALITTLADAKEVQPTEFLTVKLYVPVGTPKIVLFPVPVMDPGLIVQFPAGKPLSTTLPVATEQVGCVIVPSIGAEGVAFTVRVAAFEVALMPPLQLVTEHRYW